MSAPAGTVSLDQLSLEQLSQVRTQLEQVRCFHPLEPVLLPAAHPCPSSSSSPDSQELKHLTQAFGDLKQAQSKFAGCIDSLESIKPANKGAPSSRLSSSPSPSPRSLTLLISPAAQRRRSSSR